MKPVAFEYFRPQSVNEATLLLELHGNEAIVLAGGQSLLPMMKLRLARPGVVVDIGAIKELKQIREDESAGRIRIGALVTHEEVASSKLLQEKCPLVADAARYIGNIHIRYRGTLGGSLCQADPSAQLPTVLTALEAEVVVEGAAGHRRSIDIENFFLTYLTTSLEETEVMLEASLDAAPAGQGFSFAEFSDKQGGFPLVCVAALVDLDADSACRRLRLVVGGVDAVPLRIVDAEECAQGRAVDSVLRSEIVDIAADQMLPGSDMLHSADHKKDIALKLVSSALIEASQMAEAKAR